MISDKNVEFGDVYYQVYWWPHEGSLYHDEDALMLISERPFIEPDILTSLSGALE